MSLSRKQRDNLMEHVYRALRDYHGGVPMGNSTCVGQLDQRLTAVYDRIKAHVPIRKNRKP